MIHSVKGVVVCCSELENGGCVVLESKSGFSFNFKVSSFTLKNCREIGSKIKLFAHLVVRENMFELFGFSNETEKEIFKMLISVAGVGPSFAISVLSAVSVDDFVNLVICGNEKALCCCKGIGKKTASRIVLELKNKVEKFKFSAVDSVKIQPLTNEKFDEAVSALIALGYDKTKAYGAVYEQEKSLDCKSFSVQTLVKNALQKLSMV